MLINRLHIGTFINIVTQPCRLLILNPICFDWLVLLTSLILSFSHFVRSPLWISVWLLTIGSQEQVYFLFLLLRKHFRFVAHHTKIWWILIWIFHQFPLTSSLCLFTHLIEALVGSGWSKSTSRCTLHFCCTWPCWGQCSFIYIQRFPCSRDYWNIAFFPKKFAASGGNRVRVGATVFWFKVKPWGPSKNLHEEFV